MSETDLVTGEDGHDRCGWGASSEDYAHYHDTEWGRATIDERTLFEKMCLEGFQSGLSWITILRKRPAFREAFCNFDAKQVAEFDEPEVLELLTNAGIIRHRGKIEATVNNARALLDLHESGRTLAQVIWAHEPNVEHRPETFADVSATTDESVALAKELKRLGFRFVGPTTAYAAMQAMGIVNDHLVGCWMRDECAAERERTKRP